MVLLFDDSNEFFFLLKPLWLPVVWMIFKRFFFISFVGSKRLIISLYANIVNLNFCFLFDLKTKFLIVGFGLVWFSFVGFFSVFRYYYCYYYDNGGGIWSRNKIVLYLVPVYVLFVILSSINPEIDIQSINQIDLFLLGRKLIRFFCLDG